MKTQRILVLLLFAIALISSQAQSISAGDARKHVGENATVSGTVASERTATGSPGRTDFHQSRCALPESGFHYPGLGR